MFLLLNRLVGGATFSLNKLLAPVCESIINLHRSHKAKPFHDSLIIINNKNIVWLLHDWKKKKKNPNKSISQIATEMVAGNDMSLLRFYSNLISCLLIIMSFFIWLHFLKYIVSFFWVQKNSFTYMIKSLWRLWKCLHDIRTFYFF